MTPSGFVDLQVNGYAGINFSDASLTLNQVAEVCAALASRGTLAFCPTVITSGMDVYRRVLPELAEAVLRSGDWPGRLLGIHLEGPFISPEDGAVGVHPREHARLPSLEVFDALYDLSGGKIALLTLAPELPGALELIRRAVERGVVVSIGHTLAGASTIRAAVKAGASLSTHLGNGCPNLLHRHQNPIWPQLAASELAAMLITDGHHLPPEVIAVMLAAKGPSRVIVTSDAAPAAGCPPGEYSFFGSRILLEPSGRLRNLERETLAGSSATMLDCMNVLAGLGLLSAEDLWRVGRDNPLTVLGRRVIDLPAGTVMLADDHFEV
ncbi:MAG: N-acetylglucosamine-6-phosphate deacetylase [Chloroflexi bacterium]|nr:MAG: N-acetylglucosamine-6-phosphate deacetylase [Chloroflexota bacterium]